MPAAKPTVHLNRTVIASPDGSQVQAVVETMVWAYPDENAPVVFAEVEAHLEAELRASGRQWTELQPGQPAPEAGDKFRGHGVSLGPPPR